MTPKIPTETPGAEAKAKAQDKRIREGPDGKWILRVEDPHGFLAEKKRLERPNGKDSDAGEKPGERRRSQYRESFLPVLAPGETKKDARKQAEARLAQLRLYAVSGELDTAGRMTVGDLMDRWLASCERSVGDRTLEGYKTLARLYVKPTLGTLLLKKLTPSHVESAIGKWRARPSTIRFTEKIDPKGQPVRVPEKVESRTVRSAFDVLRAACKYAVAMRLLTRNPVDPVKAPRIGYVEMKTLDADGFGKLVGAAEGSGLQAPILLAGLTGLRRGELLGLKWSDVDLEGRRVAVRRSLEMVAGTIRTKSPKTRGSARTIALPSLAVDMLQRHRAAQNAVRLALGLGRDPEGFVFQGEDGGPLDPIAFTKRFCRFVKRPGVPKIRFHDLRHTFATISLGAGVDLKTVSGSLGHSAIGVTANTYLHVVESLKSESADKIDSAFRGAVEKALGP